MIILRQKQFGWFGFGKKKQPEQKSPEYKCPKFTDLPPRLQQSLKEVEREWKKPETQKLLKEYNRVAIHGPGIPFTPFIQQDYAGIIFNDYLLFALQDFPEGTMMYPLISNADSYEPNILCYNIGEKKFYSVYANDYDSFEEDKNYWNLKDYIKDELDEFLKYFDPNFGYELSKEGFEDLFKKIKKAFRI